MNLSPTDREIQVPAPGVPHFDHDPYADEVMANPYPYYTRMREAGPLVWLTKYRAYATAQDALVRKALADWKQFSSARGIGPLDSRSVNDLKADVSARKPTALLEYDPPEHGPARKVLVGLLGPQALQRLRTDFAAAAEKLVEEALEQGKVDIVTDVAQKFVLQVMGDATGLPREGREHLLIFGELALNAPGPINERLRRAAEAVERAGTMEWIQRMATRSALAPQGFGAQLYALADAGEITEEEAGSLVGVFLIAAVDSTITTLINGIKAFLDHPEQWALLREQPTLARQAFDEIMRYCVSTQTLFRTTTGNVEVGGVMLPAGQKIALGVAAANRDPARWPDPDRFDILRQPTGHLGFGTGIHACLGQAVAKIEGEVLLSALARAVHSIELAGTPVKHVNNALTTYSSIPVVLHRRA